MLWGEVRIVSDGRTPVWRVPRTDVLANVTAENVRSQAAPLRFRNLAAKLDGEIGDAQARVDRVTAAGGNDSLGRTGIDTAAAGSTPVRRR